MIWNEYRPLDRKNKSPCPRKRKFSSGEELWYSCVPYFKWVEDNPIIVEKLVTLDGRIKRVKSRKKRIMSLQALYVYINVTDRLWRIWREERPDLHEAIKMVEYVIYSQKFEGAAAGIFNPNLVARDLRLAESHEVSGPDGEPIKTQIISPKDLSADELQAAILLKRAIAANREP